MLMYVILFIIVIVLAFVFIIFKNQKKSNLKMHLNAQQKAKQKPVIPISNNNTTPTEQKDFREKNTNASRTEIQQKITSLINDRNFFAAEVQINEALKHDASLHELYLLLLDIYILKKDEFAINQLLNHLRELELEDILGQARAKIRENNNKVETIDFTSHNISSSVTPPIDPLIETTATDIKHAVDENSVNFNFSPSDTTVAKPVQEKVNVIENTAITEPQADPLLDSFPELAEIDEIALNFELAQKYIELGAYDEARKLIAEQEKNYTTEQRDHANQLLKQIAS